MSSTLTQDQQQIVEEIRRFVDREVMPIASELEHRNEYPETLVQKMKDLGLFAASVPEEYGGLDLDVTTYALIVIELSRGWMSLPGVLNTHVMAAYLIRTFGTDEQKQRFLSAMARGEKRSALCITEPNAGSDVQAILTTAVRDGDHYVLNGTKMFVTNGRTGTMAVVVAKTDRNAQPPYRGMSLFLVEKGTSGFSVARDLDKLGYKGVDTCELVFDNCRVPAENLLGGVEGQGFKQVLNALEIGRINVAARAVGVATAAFEAAIRYAQQRHAFGKPIGEHQAIQLKLADMATRLQAARLLTLDAAARKDRGERCDVEAGMAKLFASEAALENSMEAMRIHGGYGFTKEFPVERYFRDAPLMIIGEGTNEIQRLVIARNLLKQYAVE